MSKRILISGIVAFSLAGAGHAQTLLLDGFNGPNLGSPGEVGSGFAVGAGGAYTSGGHAIVGTNPSYTDQNIYSLDTFDPTNTKLTWVADSHPIYGYAATTIGFSQSDIYTCAGCSPEIYLESRVDRVVFDVVGSNGFFRYYGGGPIGGSGPLTMSMSLTDTGYSWTISNSLNTLSASGLWVAGFGIGDVMSSAGGNLSVFGGTRSDAPYAFDVAQFNSVRLTTLPVPEPRSWALMLIGFGGIGAVLRNRRKTRVRFA